MALGNARNAERRQSHSGWRWRHVSLALWCGICMVAPGAVRGQDEIRNFHKKPILVAETSGHHAPVRSLVWQDGFTLFSAGEDKVVRVWSLNDGPRLVRTIRPMIWRGAAGTINALAISPTPDRQNQRYLAVGGYGIEISGADMTIFRVPGLVRTPSGEVAERLLPPSDAQGIGHRNTITALAFNPRGGMLASGSRDRNHPLVLWDAAFKPVRALGDNTGAVRALAFSPDGSRLASGGDDGSLRIWDVATGATVYFRPGHPQRPDPINTLAYSPDGQSIAVGLEGGSLHRFDLRDLAQVRAVPLRTRPDQGPVEVLAFAPDGKRLAVSIKTDKADTLDPMTLSSDLELRGWPDGTILNQRRVPGLVRALAFSPGGRHLAYSGGPAQAIYLQDVTALDVPPQELRGHGSTPYDLGFTPDSQTVAFSRVPVTPANPPVAYDGFNMRERRSVIISRDQLRRAIKEYQGWSLSGSVNAYRLELVHTDGRRRPIALEMATEQLWWSWTFVPPAPDHPQTTLAIGTASGITLFNVETGERTRVLAGHGAPVVSVVPSPDGRWLASSSLDQTVMLYPLAGCDTRPGLGASFRLRPDRLWTVTEVKRGSFAQAMGLQPGDRIDWAFIGLQVFRTPEQIAQFVAQVDRVEPGLGHPIGIQTRRRLPVPFVGEIDVPSRMPSTKRDNPVITLLLGEDNEWVVWTPQGYYDTSIDGDTRLLGWQTNPPHDSRDPTDYVPIATYSALMNRPEVLDRVWTTGNLDQALAVVPAASPPPVSLADQNQPPQITFASADADNPLPAPGALWTVNQARATVSVIISSGGKSPIRARRVIFDERLVPLPAIPRPIDPLPPDVLPLDLPPNRRVRLAVEATNASGSGRTEVMDLLFSPPRNVHPPLPPPPRLFVLGVGTETFSSPELPPVRFADKDAKDLAVFLAGRLVGGDAVPARPQEPDVLTGARASAQSITSALDHLQELMHSQQIHQGDVVAIVLAAHLLEHKGSTLIAAADTDPRDSPKPAIPSRELEDVLARMADYGCRVIVFIDGVHKLKAPLASQIKSLARELAHKRRVITFVASKEGPSEVSVQAQHGLFALGLSRVFTGADLAGPRGNRRQVYTLDQFKTALREEVLSLSGRRQEAFCYIPLEVPEQMPFALPEP
jgi:WD40 repeat protein